MPSLKDMPKWGFGFDPVSAGVKVSLVWDSHARGWCAVVPDWENMCGYGEPYDWTPGKQMQSRRIPLDEFLLDIERWCGIERPRSEMG